MNVALLTALMGKLKRMRHHRHFDMGVWGRHTECGAAYCIAGWALVMAGYKMIDEDTWLSPKGKTITRIGIEAGKVLKLTEGQRSRLFDRWNWPTVFFYDVSPKGAVKRIQHFMDTKGKE